MSYFQHSTHGVLAVRSLSARVLAALAVSLTAAPALAQRAERDAAQCVGEARRSLKPDKRIAACSRAIGSAQDVKGRSALLLARAVMYLAVERKGEAMADLNAAVRLDPDNAGALHARGFQHWLDGAYDEAVADYDRVLAKAPGSASVLHDRALAFTSLGRHDRAIRDLGAVLRVKPGDAEALLLRADIYQTLGDLLRALEDYDGVIAADPKQAYAWLGRSQVKAALGDAAGAKADAARAERLEPGIGE